jgi:uncharacterized membrane protein YcaP (DUF421 family)
MHGLYEIIGESKDQILWWQASIRAVVIFFYGLLLIRFLGRRAFGKQSALDILLAIVIGSSLSRTMTGNAPFIQTTIATAVIFALYWSIEHLAARSEFLGFVFKARPVELMRNGRLRKTAMVLTGTSRGDIEEAARQSGKANLSEVSAAVLERNGKISTLSADPPTSSASAHVELS